MTGAGWRLRAARLTADGWRAGQWSLDAIRERAELAQADHAVDDRAVLLCLFDTAAERASLPVEEMLARLREDNAGLRADDAALISQYEAEITHLRQQVNELTTRLTTAAEVVEPLRSLLVVPGLAAPKRRSTSSDEAGGR